MKTVHTSPPCTRPSTASRQVRGDCSGGCVSRRGWRGAGGYMTEGEPRAEGSSPRIPHFPHLASGSNNSVHLTGANFGRNLLSQDRLQSQQGRPHPDATVSYRRLLSAQPQVQR